MGSAPRGAGRVTFDGSVAGLAGTSLEAPIHRLWRDIGVVDYCPLHDPVDFGTVVVPDGRAVTVYTDIDRLEAHLLEHFPRDAAAIGEFARALRACLHLDIPFRTEDGLAGIVAGARTSVASLPACRRCSSTAASRCASSMPGCGTRSAERSSTTSSIRRSDVPMLTVLLPIAYAHRRMTGIPRDGWLAFGRAVERRFLELGGEIRYGAKVERLETLGGAVRGAGLAGVEVVAATGYSRPPTGSSRAPSCWERTVRASTLAGCRTSPSR